jgi:hypothetical protein
VVSAVAGAWCSAVAKVPIANSSFYQGRNEAITFNLKSDDYLVKSIDLGALNKKPFTECSGLPQLKGRIEKLTIQYYYKGVWYATVDGGKTWKNKLDITPCEKESEFKNPGTFETVGNIKLKTPFKAKIVLITVTEWSGNFLCSQFGINAVHLKKEKEVGREHPEDDD